VKSGTTLRLLIAVCLLAGVIWYLDRRLISTDERRARASRVLVMAAEEVNYLKVEKDEFSVECGKTNGVWSILHPLNARASEGEIERILSVVERMPREDTITFAQMQARELSLTDYGLRQPRARFVLRDVQGRREVLVGDDAPLGESLYVAVSGMADVYRTDREIFDAVPDSVEALRDRSILRGDVFGTTRLEIQRPGGGFIQLTRTASVWFLQQPVSARADGARISGMLEALYALQVDEFVWDPVPDAEGAAPGIQDDADARLAPYGFADETAVRITTWGNGHDIDKELVLGKQGGEAGNLVYAKRRGVPSIYLVSRSILDTFTVTVNDLRDRNVFKVAPEDVHYVCLQQGERRLVLHKEKQRGWLIVEPVQWKADDEVISELVQKLSRWRVSAFVDGVATNLAKQGLAPPFVTIELADRSPPPDRGGGDAERAVGTAEAGKPPAADLPLQVGSAPAERANVFARFGGADSVFEIPGTAVRALGAAPSDPLYYRDRTMLAVPPASVKRMALLKGGKEQSVTLNETGTWVSTSPATNRAVQAAVEDVIFFVSNLRALRVERHNPDNLAAYGLDRSGVTLTLGLSGEEGIQKSLLMGFRAKTDGIYAMVQGQDVVFVLAHGVADRISRDLVEPVSAAAPD